MFLRELGQSIRVLKGAGAQVAARLAKQGVYSIADLILNYPRDYDDRTSFVPFARLREGAAGAQPRRGRRPRAGSATAG